MTGSETDSVIRQLCDRESIEFSVANDIPR